jgi:hypothetical protein
MHSSAIPLVEVSWTKLLSLAFGPFIVLALAYWLWSDIAAEQLLKTEIWESTRSVRVPYLGGLCLTAYLMMLVWHLARAVLTRGRQVEATGSNLLLWGRIAHPLSELRPADARIEHSVGVPYLCIPMRNKGAVKIRLGYIQGPSSAVLIRVRSLA